MDKGRKNGEGGSRKRQRSSDSNQLPISKRMGDLTIRPDTARSASNWDNVFAQSVSFQNRSDASNAGPSNLSAFPHVHQDEQLDVTTSVQESLFAYEPDMSARENPHYYYANKVLFEAHMENIYHHAHKSNT